MTYTLLQNGESITNVASLISYRHNHEICLAAVEVLTLLHPVQDKVTLLCKPQELRLQLREGFAKQLATEVAPIYIPPMSPGSPFLAPPAPELVMRQEEGYFSQPPTLREAIMTLLQVNLASKEPNLTHFLLGLNLNQTEKRGRLDSGLVSPRCLQVILTQLANASFARRHPRLCEMCYRFVHDLCYDPRSSSTILRFLRTSQQEFPFFSHQLSLFSGSLVATQALDHTALALSRGLLHGGGGGGDPRTAGHAQLARLARDQMMRDVVFELRQRAWLLHTVALELHVTAHSEQYMRTELLKFLFAASTDTAAAFGSSVGAQNQASNMATGAGFPFTGGNGGGFSNAFSGVIVCFIGREMCICEGLVLIVLLARSV